ncbi:ADAMTS-like protein 2 isoform X2 [Gouania willdenowi]|uniref:ADAMTS-like protein 2 isoform X2 n=1 Tax=Gouania willdenowi TaxID=441366 RepID=UPI0010551014|nr:ADAMTS-like protein 2 isoform X2 [Gouania willdenowi]
MSAHGCLAVPVCYFLLLLQLPVLPVSASRSAEEETFQWWGEWSSWSSCSRSCGGGVHSQERHCLIQRLSSTQNVNNSYCVGSPKHYQLCANQPCPSTSISFKQHQCSQFNSKAFGRRYYSWIPLYPADYISISNKPCDLQCTSLSGERQLLVPAGDGTSCRDAKHRGVCIEGACQPVGCDGQLYSSKTVDRCGVCGGKGTSCQRVSGAYRTALTQLGYAFITNIPPGSSDIQIIERHKTENILALSDEAGNFFFNGNTVFDNPQNFHVAGTVFKYRRPSNLFSDGLEYIIAQGPILQGLNVMYYNLNGKLPYITYEYTVPLTTHDITISSAHTHPNLTFNEVNKDGGGSRGDSVGSDHDYDHHTEKEEEVEEEEPVWETPSPSPPLPPAGLLVYRPADIISHVLSHNDVEEPGPLAPPGYRSSSNLIDEPSETDNALLYSGGPSVQSAAASLDDLDLLPEPEDKTENQTLSHTLTNLHTHTHTDTHTAGVQAAITESNDFDVEEEPDISVADMYRWKVSAYAPCSSTCTTGISSSFALCVRYDGTEVGDDYCDSVTRPEPTHEFCSGKDCPPRWETSGWSECSRTCGEGVQFRTVRCWKMLSPGLDSSVYDSLCLSHDLHKPANRKACHGQSCGPQWEVSDWSECSARCGSRGFRTREVRCSMETKLCNATSQPIGSQECEGPSCDRRWAVSDWGPCSGACGEGRMVRALTCRSSSGLVMSEEQCDQSLRPLAIHPCGDRDCAPHWVEQEWQQCNATCGRGVRLRQVVCAGLEGGVFKEFPESSCDPISKPEGASSCFQRPCSKWFTTSWSQCSKTCGNGVQVREVKCYQGEDLVTRGQSCDSALRPDARQSCEIQSCPTESPVSVDDSCMDKPTANCALVLKVKLCSHWYYRKACCQSCRTPKP